MKKAFISCFLILFLFPVLTADENPYGVYLGPDIPLYRDKSTGSSVLLSVEKYTVLYAHRKEEQGQYTWIDAEVMVGKNIRGWMRVETGKPDLFSWTSMLRYAAARNISYQEIFSFLKQLDGTEWEATGRVFPTPWKFGFYGEGYYLDAYYSDEAEPFFFGDLFYKNGNTYCFGISKFTTDIGMARVWFEFVNADSVYIRFGEEDEPRYLYRKVKKPGEAK